MKNKAQNEKKPLIAVILQRLVMWLKRHKKEKYLKTNGWTETSIGTWKNMKKSGHKHYHLEEAVKEENFYWMTT